MIRAYENGDIPQNITKSIVKELKVKTEAKATPDFTMTETEKTQTSFKFDISVTDIDKVGAITKIELIRGKDVTNVENLETREFADLLSNNDYTVRVTYTYDLNDGVGKQTLIKELTIKTEEKAEETEETEETEVETEETEETEETDTEETEQTEEQTEEKAETEETEQTEEETEEQESRSIDYSAFEARLAKLKK